MHTLIRSLDPQDTLTLSGQTIPARCLVEDEDGVRILVVRNEILVDDWLDASSDGALAILRTEPLSFVLAPDFLEHRQEQGTTYTLDTPHWTGCNAAPESYRDMVATPAKPASRFVHLKKYPGYSLSPDGEVMGKGGKLLTPRPVGDTPYRRVALYVNDTRHDVLLHHLVLETFVGPRPEGMEACHADGDATNNSIENLRWDTHEANVQDRIDARTHCASGHDLAVEGKWYPNGEGKRARRCNACRREAYKRSKKKFCHLHTHSEFSSLDGLSKISEMVNAAVAAGQSAMAVTDHGNCAAHPSFQLACDAAGIKAIHGIEAYFVDDRHRKDPDQRGEYWHLVLWAMDDVGLRNLWAISTEGFKDGKYYYPRVDWDTLARHAEGVMASTACLRGPVTQPYLAGDTERALANLGRLRAIFGDRLYIELHTNQLSDQIQANCWLAEQAEAYGIPVIAVCDSHYPTESDADAHRVWLSIQTNKEISDDSSLFDGHQDYHLMTEAEVREALSHLDSEVVESAIANTGAVADRCTARIEKKSHNPVYSTPSPEHPDAAERDKERLFEQCMQRWEERTVGKSRPQEEYFARFEREFSLLAGKGFSGYMLMVWDIVSYAKRQGIMIGPGRGSGGGCLVAYLLGITELDPVELGIMFERFMTAGRTELPDFDLDFPSSKKTVMFEYIAQRWGADHMAIVCTHMRLKNKSIFHDVARALKSSLPEGYLADINVISKIVEAAEADTAGLGLSYEQLMIRAEEEFAPFRERYPEVFHYADMLNSRLRTYGSHPAGIVIDPEQSLVDNLPLRDGDNGMITQFDLGSLEMLGYIKFDLLNVNNLDILQECKDLIARHTGRVVDPYSFHEELSDPVVYEAISAGWTLGMFQVNTRAGTRLCTRYRPDSLEELAHVLTLVRPGPKNSGLQEVYLRRRESVEEAITYPDERMASILASTQGVMLFQEQLMQLCMAIAGYTDEEADKVRKILGKKKVEQAKIEGKRFVEKAIANRTDPQVAQDLWDQMEAFAKYSFGYAHAMGYAMFTVWTAWFKAHYPLYFLCAALSKVDSKKIPEFVEEARRMGYRVLPPDINLSGEGFTVDPPNLAVRYGLLSLDGLGGSAVGAVLPGQPYADFDDFTARKGDKCNAGHIKRLNQIGAFESLGGHRRWLEKRLELESVASSGACVSRDETKGEGELPCSFDWSSLPPAVGKSGKLLKKQPGPPLKCTKACKQFTPRQPAPPEEVAPYTDEDIRQIERSTLGVYLSSTPFDRLDPADREACLTAEDVMEAPDGEYLIAALVKSVKPWLDVNANTMAFVDVTTERGELPVTVFSRLYEEIRSSLKPDTLCLMLVRRNARGQTLESFIDLDRGVSGG